MLRENTVSKFHVRQLEGEIKRLFDEHICLDDVTDEKKKHLCFLSRGLAAYSLQILADITAEEAAHSVVDGFDDIATPTPMRYRLKSETFAQKDS